SSALILRSHRRAATMASRRIATHSEVPQHAWERPEAAAIVRDAVRASRGQLLSMRFGASAPDMFSVKHARPAFFGPHPEEPSSRSDDGASKDGHTFGGATACVGEA